MFLAYLGRNGMKELIYLAHSVHRRELGKEIQAMLEDMGYEVYNPFYPTDPRAYRNDIEALDKGQIVPWDIPDKDRADWMILAGFLLLLLVYRHRKARA